MNRSLFYAICLVCVLPVIGSLSYGLGSMMAWLCTKPTEIMNEDVDMRATDSIMQGTRVLYYDIDEDSLITASWEYPDGRIGGTDWTDADGFVYEIGEQRSWPECSDSACRHVRPPDQEDNKCWRHYPIPDLEPINKSLTDHL